MKILDPAHGGCEIKTFLKHHVHFFFFSHEFCFPTGKGSQDAKLTVNNYLSYIDINNYSLD